MLTELTTQLSKLLSPMKNPWAITGSFNLYLRNIWQEPNDLDIITNRNGAFEIDALLNAYMVKNVRFQEFERIRSFYGKARIDGFIIEFMGEPHNLLNKLWIKNSKWMDNIEFVFLNGRSLPIITLNYEFFINLQIGNKIRVDKIGREFLQLETASG